jgi:hypothetical protein
MLSLMAAGWIAAYQMKTAAPFMLFPSIAIALYGLGWLVASAMSETKWLRVVSTVSFIASVVIALAADSKAEYLLMAAALLLLMALPGWLLTRAEPSDVV